MCLHHVQSIATALYGSSLQLGQQSTDQPGLQRNAKPTDAGIFPPHTLIPGRMSLLHSIRMPYKYTLMSWQHVAISNLRVPYMPALTSSVALIPFRSQDMASFQHTYCHLDWHQVSSYKGTSHSGDSLLPFPNDNPAQKRHWDTGKAMTLPHKDNTACMCTHTQAHIKRECDSYHHSHKNTQRKFARVYQQAQQMERVAWIRDES